MLPSAEQLSSRTCEEHFLKEMALLHYICNLESVCPIALLPLPLVPASLSSPEQILGTGKALFNIKL